MTGHAVRFSSGWQIWRPVVVRAPGFSSEQATRLCSRALARAADRLAGQPVTAAEEWATYRSLFAAEAKRIGSVIEAIADEPRFQFAVAWQNHKLIAEAIEPMLRAAQGGGGRNGKRRQREELIANYWQRYCLKNDTIGFFGPVGWGRLDPATADTSVRTGPDLLASSETFFEIWAVDALADVLAAEPGMADWVPPALVPFIRVDGARIMRSAGPPLVLSAAEAAVIAKVNGLTPAGQIAEELAADPGLTLSRGEVLAIMDGLRRRRILTWKLQLPLSPHPERDLRRFLGTVADPALAAAGLAKLERLEAARGTVSLAAAGPEPAGFIAALRQLDAVFTELTGTQPSRNGGKPYGGRTLVYHDARRDLDIALGADVIAALAPMDLLLQAARWLTYHFKLALDTQFRSIGERLASASGWPVNLATFWFACLPLLHKSAGAIADELQRECQRRWAAILRCPADQPRVHRSLDELREPVAAAFEAPHSGWSAGRYCSPDILVAAPSQAAIRRGDFEVILGEMHLSLASLRHSCFVTQHPRPAELFDCVTQDNPGPRLMTVPPKEDSGRLTIRTQPALIRDEDFLVAFADQTVDASRPRLLRASDLTVTPAGTGLRVTVDDQHAFDIADLFSEMLTNVIVDKFAVFPAQPHVPRVSIDKLIISRETWRFRAQELTFATVLDEADRFAAARAWWRTVSLPSKVFVKAPNELKPFFVDFCSPLYVSLLAKVVRRLSAQASADGSSPMIQFSEMLPGISDLWLADGAGNRYTSEIRLVAVDSRGPLPGLP